MQRDEETLDDCRSFCGTRASFDGEYERPPAKCTPAQVNATRGRFNAAYAKRQYTLARDLLRDLPQRCSRYLPWWIVPEIANDLALAQLRSGDPSACLRTLEHQFGADLDTPDETIRDAGNLPPSDADDWLRWVAAARFNRSLCRAALR